MIALKEKRRVIKRMDTKKVMATFAVLMIALSVAGFVYAHWSDSVQIEGTVHMGELIVGILDIKDCWDNEPTLPVPKDVGKVKCTLEDPETSKHHDPPQTVYHTMIVTVTDAYPNLSLIHISEPTRPY